MKNVIHLICFILIFIAKSYSQDTLTTKLDTTFCMNQGEIKVFTAKYEKDSTIFLWSTGDTTSSIAITTNGIYTLKAIDTSKQIMHLDTFMVNLKIYPQIDYQFTASCFGTNSYISNNSIYDTSYTKVNYKWQSIEISDNKKVINYQLNNNPDSASLNIKFITLGCGDKDTVYTIKNIFSPQVSVTSIPICYGDSTAIINSSIFTNKVDSVITNIEGFPKFLSKSSFKVFLDKNGENRTLKMKIIEGVCQDSQTLIISNKLQPTAAFQSLKTCENQKLKIKNNSDGVLATTSYMLKYLSISNTFTNIAEFELPDTLKAGIVNLQGIVINENGCKDTSIISAKIDSVDYVNFMLNDLFYCENQDVALLTGLAIKTNNKINGQFIGQFILNLGMGDAEFRPLAAGINIPITFSYTNQSGCKDEATKFVKEVYKKPSLLLDGLKDRYCQFDNPSELILNQTQGNSTYQVFNNNQLIESLNAFKYNFIPDINGNFKVRVDFKDLNDCTNFIEKFTVVNPLPSIDLGDTLILEPGTSKIIGTQIIEPFVTYEWSTQDVNSSIEVFLPGIYKIYALNSLTSCENEDSINVVYNETIFNQFLKIKIFPNPTIDIINIEIGKSINNIEILNIFGIPQILNNVSKFQTDSNGKLSLNLSQLEKGNYVLKIPEIGNFIIVRI
jgi:hypothetical protein